MKKYILLILFCLLSKSALTQAQTNYFPLEVGNKWIYRAWSQFGGWGDKYITRFEVKGKEIINGTLYYIADCNLFYSSLNMKYFRKDSLGNIYTRCNNVDKLLFKMNAKLFETFSASCYGSLQRVEGWWNFTVNPKNFPFGSIGNYIMFHDMNIRGNDYVFAESYGCAIGMFTSEDPMVYLRQAINGGKIITPQAIEILSIGYYTDLKKILLKTLAIMDTTSRLILESKKQGKFLGYLKRFKIDPLWDSFHGPCYSIESEFDLSKDNDTVKITVPATVADILGDKVDGNENQVWEGSPTDDYTVTVIIPAATNNVDIPGTLQDYKLNQNYPNPFNPSTKISFSILKNGFV